MATPSTPCRYLRKLVISIVGPLLAALVSLSTPAWPNGIVIGLDADMSGGAASGGEAIRRGILLAIDEINARGGVLGRPLELEVRDHRGNPARGVDNIAAFARTPDLVAVIGGVHTPVALAELDLLHQEEILFLVPWAAGTPIVANGFRPNFVFRVSVRDEFAGGFLIDQVLARGFSRPGLLLERTGWGRSNDKAMQTALQQRDQPAAPVAWFNWGARTLKPQLDALAASGADVVLLVSNPREGAVAVRDMAGLADDARLPIVSHWGITGGDFASSVRDDVARIDLTFLQTFSFFRPPFPERAERVLAAYCARFVPCTGPADVISPVGTAHAYDLTHLLARAIARAGSIDRRRVRTAMERLDRYEGLVRVYDPPFAPDRHDALTRSDFQLSRFGTDGAILPLDGS